MSLGLYDFAQGTYYTVHHEGLTVHMTRDIPLSCQDKVVFINSLAG